MTIDKDVTLDLNGNNVTATDCRAFLVSAGAFEITGTGTVSATAVLGTEATPAFKTGHSVIKVGGDTAVTSFTLGQNVRVESDYCYGVTYFGSKAQTVTINGTVAVTGTQAAISGNGNSWNAAATVTVNGTVSATQDYAIYNPQRGATTVNGTVTGLGGIEMKAGALTVGANASITATATTQSHSTNNNGTSTVGYAIASVGNAAYPGDPAVTINGGTITGKAIVLAENGAEEAGTITATVATISTDPDYKWVAEGNGYKLVAKTYVAEVAGQGYETLQEAINAAVEAYDGEPVTVELLVDIPDGRGLALFNNTSGYPAANDVEIVVDFGGFTYTVVGPAVGSQNTQNQVLHFEAGNTVTLKNGTIKMTEDQTALAGFQMFMQNYGSLTIEDMALDGTGIAIAKYGTFTGNWAVFSNTDKPQFNYNTAGGSVIRNSTITMPGDLGVDDNASLLIEDDAVINVRKVVTKGTDDRYAAANPTLLVQNGAKFSYDCSAILAANQKVVEDAGVYTVAEATYVAQIGEQKFEDFASAMAAASNGDTVTLLNDVELTERLFVNAGATVVLDANNRYATTSEDKAITLDLSGYSITSSSNIALAGGSLTITGIGTIATTNDGLAPVEVRGTGDLATKRTLTIGEYVTLSGSEYGLNVFGSNDAQKNVIDVTVNGRVEGTLFVLGNLKNAENAINIVINGTVLASPGVGDDVNVGIALNGNANLTVNTGAVVSGDSGIEVRAGSLTLNGGTITATAEAYSYKANGSGSTTKGAAISIAQHTTVLPTAVTLNGGTLVGVEKVYVKDVNSNMSDVTVQATAGYTATATVPAGYKWSETATEGVYELVPATYVAKIGEQGYETLQAAVDAVPAAGTEYTTVTILDDIELEARVVVSGKKVDFEAASPVTVSCNADRVLNAVNGASVKIGANVTLTSTAHPTLFATGCASTSPYVSAAKTTIEIYGKVMNTNPGFDQTFTISSNGTDNEGVDITVYAGGEVSNANGIAIYQPQPGTLTVNGTVVGASAITIKDGTLIVGEGAVITATYATYAGHTTNGNGASPSGDAIQVPYYPASMGYGTPVVKVTGGTITVTAEGAAGIQAYDNNNVVAPEDSTSNIAVSGGTFNALVAQAYCATGYKPSYNATTGKYGVEEGEYSVYIGTTGYETLDAALEGAVDGDTITLLANVEAERTIIEKSVTLDLGGKTITGRVSIFSGTVTVKNGAIVGRFDAYDDSVVTLAATATVTGQVVVWGDGTFGTAGCKTPTLNVYGTVTNTGDAAITCNGTDKSQAVINVYDDASVTSTDDIAIYMPSGKLTVSGGTITGATAVYSKSGSVAITGGTLTGNGEAAAYQYYGNGAYATGDALVVESCSYPNGAPTALVTGGTLVSVNAKAIGCYATTGNNVPKNIVPAKVGGVENAARFKPVESMGIAAGYQLVADGETGFFKLGRIPTPENTVDVVSVSDTTLVAVPANYTADKLINRSNRAIGDILKAYVKSEKRYYTWRLVALDGDDADAWTPVQTWVVGDNESVAPASTKAATAVGLKKGEAVWVTRVDSSKPVYVNGEYLNREAEEPEEAEVKVEVETGYNLVAPVPTATEAAAAEVVINEVVEKTEETVADNDKILVPPTETSAPVALDCKVNEDTGKPEWGYDYIETYTDDAGNIRSRKVRKTNVKIPSGTGFWYISGRNKEISL